MNLTPEQERAVRAPGSVAVVAGAGTGKTQMLSRRYLYHLENGLSPLELLAVTFTERAADELRARIRREVLRSFPERPDVRSELEAAQISTLHALAARICREHPQEAQVPPDFAVLEEVEGSIWRAERFEEALADLPPALFGSAPYSTLRATLRTLLQEPVVAAWALEHGADAWAEALAEAKREILEELRNDPLWCDACATVRSIKGAEGDKLEDVRRLAIAGLEALAEGDIVQAQTLLGMIDLRKGSAKAWADMALAKEALKTVRETFKLLSEEGIITLELGDTDTLLTNLLPSLREAFHKVRSSLKAAKRRARVLDFADLEEHALLALEHPHVQAHYRERWRAVLVDEFQDTNPVQAELLRRLCADTRLTVVGDEKQSIYGFRGADVTVFREFRQTISSSGGSEVILSQSFRTHASLMTRINRTFSPILGALHQELTASREPLEPAPCLTLQTIVTEERVAKSSRQVAEARAIAEQLKEMLERKFPVFDPGTGGTRPLRPGDIAILARNWRPLEVYGEVLPSLGVRAVHTGGGNLLETREAKDALLLLRFLADPNDSLALAGLLRSPFFAVSDPVLYLFSRDLPAPTPADSERDRPKKVSWWRALEDGLPCPFPHAQETLRALLKGRYREEPSRLLQHADRLTGYSAIISNLPGAARREADWRGFIDFVRRLEAQGDDVFAVTRRLRKLLLAEADVPRPTLEADDAVSLMTIHKSKGLEWPVVVLANLDHSDRGGSSPVLFHHGMGVAIKLTDDEGEQQEGVLYKLLKRQQKQLEEEETKRLLYVGCTRARDRLILSATEANRGLLKVLQAGLEAAEVTPDEVTFDAAAALYPNPPAPEVAEGDEGTLWQFSAVAPIEAPTPQTKEAGDWGEVLELLPAFDERWLPLLEALSPHLPPPHPDNLFIDLMQGTEATQYTAICLWHVADKPVALVQVGTPDDFSDYSLVFATPEEEAEGVLNALLPLLKNG